MKNNYSLKKTAPVALKVALLAALLILVAVPAWATERILVLGDSLSDAYNMPREAGWVHLLDQQLGDRYVMIDGSISGDTTSGALARLDALLQTHQPSYMIVILGGNDGLRGLSPTQLRANLDGIIVKAQQAGAEVALMQIQLPANLGRRYLQRFEAVYPQLAKQYSIPLWPFFLEALFDQPGMMMDDGIHPSEQAQPDIARIMYSHIQRILPPTS